MTFPHLVLGLADHHNVGPEGNLLSELWLIWICVSLSMRHQILKSNLDWDKLADQNNYH